MVCGAGLGLCTVRCSEVWRCPAVAAVATALPVAVPALGAALSPAPKPAPEPTLSSAPRPTQDGRRWRIRQRLVAVGERVRAGQALLVVGEIDAGSAAAAALTLRAPSDGVVTAFAGDDETPIDAGGAAVYVQAAQSARIYRALLPRAVAARLTVGMPVAVHGGGAPQAAQLAALQAKNETTPGSALQGVAAVGAAATAAVEVEADVVVVAADGSGADRASPQTAVELEFPLARPRLYRWLLGRVQAARARYPVAAPGFAS